MTSNASNAPVAPALSSHATFDSGAGLSADLQATADSCPGALPSPDSTARAEPVRDDATFCEDCGVEIAAGYVRCIRCARQRLDVRFIRAAVRAGRISVDVGHNVIESRLAEGVDPIVGPVNCCVQGVREEVDRPLCPVCSEKECSCCAECGATFPADCQCGVDSISALDIGE
jgi:hypothetical protein